jgi:hypothetical protein
MTPIADHPGTPQVTRHRDPTPWWARVGAAVSVLAVGVICGIGIYNQGVTGEDRFGASGVTLIVWFAAAIAGIVTWFIVRRVTVTRVLVVAALMSGIVSFTWWQIRPQAPTADAHQEQLVAGNNAATVKLKSTLDRTLPGRWKLRFVASPDGCRDWLGRTRGAARITSYVDIKPHLTLAELDAFGRELTTEGWAVTTPSNDFGAQQGRRLEATRNGYSISVDTAFDELTVYRDGRVSDDENEIYLTTPFIGSGSFWVLLCLSLYMFVVGV